MLSGRLSGAVQRINPSVPYHALQQAVKEVERIHSPELLANNEAFHRLLTEGVKVSYSQDGSERGDLVWLIDFANPENNEFIVANQFTVIENDQNKRPDIVLFVNGLPLVVVELKNAIDENTTLKSAYQQLETYKHTIPSLFTYNALLVISDGLEAKAGSLSAGLSRFMVWKSADGKSEVKTVEDLQAAESAMRTSAKRVQSIIKQSLPEKEATQLLDVLDNMVPAQRVFAN